MEPENQSRGWDGPWWALEMFREVQVKEWKRNQQCQVPHICRCCTWGVYFTISCPLQSVFHATFQTNRGSDDM